MPRTVTTAKAAPPKTARTSTYLLRDVDEVLWRRVKSKAALEGISLKDLFETLLTDWVCS